MMLESEARAKLRYYQADYGNWVLSTTPEAARQRAQDCRQRALLLDPESDLECLRLLESAVHFDAVAACLECVGSNVVEFKSLDSATQDELYATDASDRDDVGDSYTDIEIFSMAELTQRSPKIRFKVGDPAWVVDYDESNTPIGYLPCTIVGYELYPDELFYLIGFYDEEFGTVETNFESVEDAEVFAEMPTALPTAKKIVKSRPVLKIVK